MNEKKEGKYAKKMREKINIIAEYKRVPHHLANGAPLYLYIDFILHTKRYKIILIFIP